MRLIPLAVALLCGLASTARSADLQLVFKSPSGNLRLESFEYAPKKWNGKVIIMSHGSTGGNKSAIKASLKFLNISKEATDNGYAFVSYMRKGRGASEGEFTEETGRCDEATLKGEMAEAEAQLNQVVAQVMAKYAVRKVILMGHSRGGMLSVSYAMKHPAEVSAVVNLAGAWSAYCENKNGGFGHKILEASAKSFKPQFWAYFKNDTYFMADRFNDPDYKWMSSTAAANKVSFGVYSDGGRSDGHQAPTWVPREWAQAIFPQLVKLQ